jgi:hypothetical protein
MPEQKPVAWLSKNGKGIWFHEPDASLNATPLYTSPPQRQWVGLTDLDLQEIIGTSATMGEFIKNTEAKLKENNK